MCREQASTITNAQHRPQLPGRRVQPAAQLPVIDLRLLPGLGRARVHTRTCDRRISSGTFAATYRRKLCTLTASPCSSRSRWWIVDIRTPAFSCPTM